LRARAARGELVGVAPALTGAPSALSWRAAGTRLLAIPPGAFAAAVGPVPGPPPAERAELERLLDETPAFAAAGEDQRLGLLAGAQPVDLAPGQAFTLTSPTDTAVVASGVLARADGGEARHGDLLGPPADHAPVSGTARSRVRLWTLPAVGGAGALLHGLAAPIGTAPAQRAPAAGVHPVDVYAPLALPAGPPPPAGGGRAVVDDRFDRRLRRFALLLLLLALLLALVNTQPGRPWTEMPGDRALLDVDAGTVALHTASTGAARTIVRGDRSYVAAGDTVRVGPDGQARLRFGGGSQLVVCADSEVGIDRLRTRGRPAAPEAAVSLEEGRMLADTRSTSHAFESLELEARTGRRHVAANHGAARFVIRVGGVDVADGEVTLDHRSVLAGGGEPSCERDSATERASRPDTPPPRPEPVQTPPPPDPPPTTATTTPVVPADEVETPPTETTPPASAPPTTAPPTTASPVAFDATATTTTAEPVTVTLRADHPGGDRLFFSVEDLPAHGTVTVAGDQATYTPEDGFTGTDQFTFRTTDPAGASAVARVTITVVAPSRVPTTLSADPSIAAIGPELAIPLTLVAHLSRTDTGEPLPGRVVAFSLSSGNLCRAATDHAGTATCGGIVGALLSILDLGYHATFAGDDDAEASTARGPIVTVFATLVEALLPEGSSS
ncbi:MAG: Ig-like domain-containing protein, partial [Acidimicrobiales bacterium]